MRTLRCAIVVTSLLASSTALAQPLSQWGTPRIDPFALAAFSHRARFGETFPLYMRSERLEREGTLPVVVRFAARVSQQSLVELQSQGVHWHRLGVPLASGAYGARVTEAGLAALDADPNVARVSVDLPVQSPLPLDASFTETRADAAGRATQRADGTELDGRGVVIADVDTGVFVFHPALFRPDAGVFAWVDVNADGALTPGTDGVDIDRDGVIAPTEVLSVLRARSFSRSGEALDAQTGALRPTIDWLYLDANGNGRRDWGAASGEDTPAYGEPVFQAEDADRNGAISPAERLWRLGTSRLRAVYSDRDYVRGDTTNWALSQYDLSAEANGSERVSHGTGVAGILIAGSPAFSQRFGLSTGAELITIEHRAFTESTGTTGAIQRGIDAGANVILTEFAPYAGVTLDGSSEAEALLDAAVGQNIVVVSPGGNLATGSKHLHVTLQPGLNRVPVRTDASFEGARSIVFSMHHRARNRALSVHFTAPGDLSVDLPDSAPRGMMLSPTMAAYVVNRTTARGTVERHITTGSPRVAMVRGDYAFDITLSAGAPVEVDLYLADNINSWARGATFTRNDATRTLCHPSTSDLTITVAAYTLHGESAYSPSSRAGELAAYSSLGPLIGGEPGVEIAAPDNPMSLTPPNEPRVGATGYAPFGGTSGAGPHVAAAVALLRQRFPDESAMDLRARITDHARHDTFTTADTARWGAGKLDVLAALGEAPSTGRPPTLTLRADARVRTGRDIVLTVDARDDGATDALRVRWDTDYDGQPDTAWVPIAEQRVATDHDGVYGVRVELRDADGYVRAAVARIEAVRDLPDPVITPDAGAPSDAAMPPATDDSGCSCDLAGSARPRGSVLFTALALGAALRRRKR